MSNKMISAVKFGGQVVLGAGVVSFVGFLFWALVIGL